MKKLSEIRPRRGHVRNPRGTSESLKQKMSLYDASIEGSSVKSVCTNIRPDFQIDCLVRLCSHA
ncbi:MAG: hypothetical protein JWM63_2118 [Gammaproteobacteria bacterium]|jgi:hypothetical protein|nr:hypothetical protein [Gammaproteobacteria bacterium]